FFFFFFQAEDGIRDRTVTGVQTCALPISSLRSRKLTEVVSRSSRRSTASSKSPTNGFTVRSSAQYRRERAPEDVTRSIVPAGSLLMPSQIDWGAGTYPKVRNASNALRFTRRSLGSVSRSAPSVDAK